MFSVELLGFLFYLFCLNEVSSSRCCKYLRTIRLMDCMGCDLEKVPVFNEQDSIVTLNLRRNNLTWIDLKTFSEYKNLKVIDLRQNPLVCGKIELLQFEVKSDSHSTATVKSKKYHNTPIPKSSEVPEPSSPYRSIHSPAIPSQRIYNATRSSLHHEKPLTITSQLLYTSHRPTLPVSQTYNRTEEIALSFSVFIISLLIILICIKLKLYLCCRRDRRENSNQVIPMSFTSSSSSGSSNTVFSTTSL